MRCADLCKTVEVANMEREQIRRFLNYYDSALVDHAVRRANLSAQEWEAVHLREFSGETVESAAERLDISPGTIKNRYRAGMEKLDGCWTGLGWVQTILREQNRPQ